MRHVRIDTGEEPLRLVLDARSASLGALFDDASLIAPTTPQVDEAVSRYRERRSTDTRWLTGRFLCPASRLTDLAVCLTRSLRAGEPAWEIGVVLDGDSGVDAAAAQAFHAEMQPAARVASAHARIVGTDQGSAGALVDAITSIQPEIVPFLEIDTACPIARQVTHVASALTDRSRVGGIAMRCGEGSPSPPPPDKVTGFIMEAISHRIPFKMIGDIDRSISHHDHELGVHRFGFVNLLIATAAATQGRTTEIVTAIVAEEDPDAFSMGAAFVSWKDVSIPGPTMRRVRAGNLIAFDAFDMEEAIAALTDLRFIGDGM